MTSNEQASAPLKAKVAAITQLRTNESELLAAINHVSALLGDQTVEPGDLRALIEARDVELSQSLLTKFDATLHELDELDETLASLRQTCQTLDERLQRTKRVSGALIEQTDALG